jgi:hypothetical protein
MNQQLFESLHEQYVGLTSPDLVKSVMADPRLDTAWEPVLSRAIAAMARVSGLPESHWNNQVVLAGIPDDVSSLE